MHFLFKKTALVAAFTLFSAVAFSQSFTGATIDGRSGINFLLTNPAGIVDSKLKLDINLISSSGIVSNDYASINLSDVSKLDDGVQFDDDVIIDAQDQNNFVGNMDILGPAVLLNIGDYNSIALSSRFRGFFNLNNIGGEFYQVLNDENSEIDDFSLSMEDLHGLIHVWGEIGLSYGRILIDDRDYVLKGGLTLKYLMGAGGVYGSSQVLGAQYSSSTELINTSGQFHYGYTSGFDSEDIGFSDLQAGFGADLGFIFQLNESTLDPFALQGHKLQVGISLMDLGSINYKSGNTYSYDANASVPIDEFLEKDLEEVLEDNYEGTERIQDIKLALPTSLQLFADYLVVQRFYINLHGSLSVKKHQEIPVTQLLNQFTITPRFETRWISVYSPVSFREYAKGVYWGLGLRAGPLTIGSGSLMTNLLSKSSQSADFYIGLKVPIYKK